MNYIEIDFNKVKGYSKLSDAAKRVFENTYKIHNSGLGNDYKHKWIPTRVKEHRQYIEVYFQNGDWLHYYANST